MCIFQHSNISHSRTFITYKLTYQSTNFMCSLVPSFDFFRVALFALCVCLKVPPLLCFMFPCLQFVFVCQFHPCCVSRPSCFSMFGPGWHQVWFCWQFFTLIQKLSWWLCSELRTFTYSPLIAWLSLPHRHDNHINPPFGCQSLLYGAVGWSLHPYWEKAQWLIYARQVKRPIKQAEAFIILLLLVIIVALSCFLSEQGSLHNCHYTFSWGFHQNVKVIIS